MWIRMDTSNHYESIIGSLMKSIDIKSLLIGILGTLLVIAWTGAVINIKPQSGGIGKYAISCTAWQGYDCYVLDTQSGLIIGSVSTGYIEENTGLVDPKVFND